MASATPHTATVTPDSLITIKISVNDTLKKLKLPLRDLGANVLPNKLRQVLDIQPEQTIIFERFSDSAGSFITLDPDKPQAYKTLMRAAKAKLKLRLKATVMPLHQPEQVPELHAYPAAIPAKVVSPVIVSSPIYTAALRDSTALDRRSNGSGIFEFREARASQQTLLDTAEAPVPEPFNTKFAETTDDVASLAQDVTRKLVIRSREPPATVLTNGQAWSVYCNECDVAMADAHYHCNICDGGDYDLCEACVDGGHLCPGEGHWLIKRFIKDGKVVTSTSVTERVFPRKVNVDVTDSEKAVPGAFAAEVKPEVVEMPSPARTCNSCVVVRSEDEFVTCAACSDFDLCLQCHIENRHGHHPGHAFKPATDKTVLTADATKLLAAGRNVSHNAICDGCDKSIHGVRHKCLNCPDWDYCSECVTNAAQIHPRHRFAALHEPLADAYPLAVRHFGIYCDGPLCNDTAHQTYITGVRYKCAVCDDTDFCAACEALPTNTHNRTHPLIKFKTAVRGVTITTQDDDGQGSIRRLGDTLKKATRTTSTETTPISQAHAATQVQTMAEITPTETTKPTNASSSPVPVQGVVPSSRSPYADTDMNTRLNATFVQDSIPDGMVMRPGARFTQIWTMRNPGPYVWPAGCSVRFVGGDNMLNIDNNHPAAWSEITAAKESNVIARDVRIGEEVAFKVDLKAPTRIGKAISYWRLKSSDGIPFGHRLWCDVEVQEPAQGQKAPELSTTPMQPPSFGLPPNTFPYSPQFRPYYQQQLSLQQRSMMQQRLLQHQQSVAQQAMYQQATAHSPFATASRVSRSYTPSMSPDAKSTSPSTSETHLKDSDRVRKEAAKLRVEHIKAKILRAREEKAKALSAAREEIERATLEAKKAAAAEVAAIAAKSAAAESVAPAPAEAKVEEMQDSQMVFPKLEKESPASSTYQSFSGSSSKGKAAYVENEEEEVEQTATIADNPVSAPAIASPTTEPGYDDLTDDLEVLSADGEQSEDDGFLTDEEYDILDASDQETVASK